MLQRSVRVFAQEGCGLEWASVFDPIGLALRGEEVGSMEILLKHGHEPTLSWLLSTRRSLCYHPRGLSRSLYEQNAGQWAVVWE